MGKRLYYLDYLRVVLTVLVLLHHTAITYGAEGSWIFKDVETNEMSLSTTVLSLFTAVNQSFFMGLFFFLSGYFTPASFNRKGAISFLKDRLIRLGVPLLAYIFILGPYVQYIVNFKNHDSFAEFYRIEIVSFTSINIGPLWYVEALLIFSFLYVLFCQFTFGKQPDDLPFPSVKKLILIAIGLGMTAFVLRLFWPTGKEFFGLQLGYFPSYILLFVVGIIAYKHHWLENIPIKTTKLWGWFAVIAVPILPIVLLATGALEGNMTVSGGLNFQAFVYAMWEPFVCIGTCLWLLSKFKLQYNKSRKIWKYLSTSAYTLYIIHPLILVQMSLFLQDAPLTQMGKFFIVGITAPIIGFLISYGICRIPSVKRVL